MRKINKNNKTKITGISWNSRTNRWVAKTSIGNKQYHLGYFTNMDDAHIRIMEWRDEMIDAGIITKDIDDEQL